MVILLISYDKKTNNYIKWKSVLEFLGHVVIEPNIEVSCNVNIEQLINDSISLCDLVIVDDVPAEVINQSLNQTVDRAIRGEIPVVFASYLINIMNRYLSNYIGKDHDNGS